MKGLGLSLLLVVAFGFALYARTLGFSFSYLDDDELVLEDRAFLTQPAAAFRAFGRPYFGERGRDHAYYRPLVTASFALDARLSGREASGYRTTNLLIHLAVASLLLLVLEAEGYARAVAVFGALVFAVHPALVSAVAWIPGRGDLLLALFALAAWLALLRFERQRAPASALLHGACLFLALVSKEAALALPLVFVARARVIERRAWRDVASPRLLATWGVVLASYLVLRALALGSTLGMPAPSGALLASGAGALVSGLGSLLLPFRPLAVAVPADVPLWPGLLALGLVAAALWVPGLSRRRLFFALLAYLALALPSLPASGALVLESRLYLPAVAIALGASEVLAALPVRPNARLALGSFLVALGASSAYRYSSGFSARLPFASMLALASPRSSLAHRNLGVAYQLGGNTELARRSYQRALAQDPDERLVHNNLGVLLMAEGKLEEAERELRAELSLDPDSKQAKENLALVLRAVTRP